MKKVVSLFLTLVLAMSLAVPAFAASEATFSLNAKTATVEAGDSLSLELKVDKAMKDVESFEFWIYYNAEVFELTSGEAGKCCGAAKVAHSSKSFSDAKGAYYKVTAADFTNGLFDIKAGTIYTLTFKAKDTVTAGTATFTLSNEGVYGKLNTTRDVTTGSPVSVTTAAKTVNVTSITLSSTTMNLEVGQTGTLTATVKPDNATNKTVTWKTSNDKVATVVDGTVAAVGEGTATITATAANGKKDTCKVTVKVPAHKHTPVAVPAQESTCMEKGWEAYYKCSVCDAVVDKDGKAAQIVYLPLAAHKLTETKAVPATCTEDGTEAYWTCSVCKKMFADKDGKKEIKAPVKVAALGHDIVENEDPAVVGVLGSKMWLYSATCKNCQKTVYVANLVMPENTINVIAKQSADSKKDFSKAVTFGVKASDSKETLKFSIDPVTADIVAAAKTEAGYKVTESLLNGAYGWGLVEYSESPEAAYAALAEYLKDGITFTQTISAKEKTWAADAKSHTMTFDINTTDGTFTVQVDGKDESTMTFTNTFTYKKATNNGGNTDTKDDNTKNDGKKVESGKTFDAGIAMYVGLSVLSVTGGALVIGKKKERF